MIIYPSEREPESFIDVVAGMNLDPKPGDEGHVDDHARLSKVLFDAVHTAIDVAVAMKEDGQWLFTWTNSEPPQPVTFAELRGHVERPGLIVTASESEFADGTTDWADGDSFPDGAHLSIKGRGLVGLAYAAENTRVMLSALAVRSSELSDRLDTLEAAQA